MDIRVWLLCRFLDDAEYGHWFVKSGWIQYVIVYSTFDKEKLLNL